MSSAFQIILKQTHMPAEGRRGRCFSQAGQKIFPEKQVAKGAIRPHSRLWRFLFFHWILCNHEQRQILSLAVITAVQ